MNWAHDIYTIIFDLFYCTFNLRHIQPAKKACIINELFSYYRFVCRYSNFTINRERERGKTLSFAWLHSPFMRLPAISSFIALDHLEKGKISSWISFKLVLSDSKERKTSELDFQDTSVLNFAISGLAGGCESWFSSRWFLQRNFPSLDC